MRSLETVFETAQILPRQNLTAQVYQLLRRFILSMELLPFQALPVKEIAALLGISKTPVREAMIKLADESLIRVIPKSRTYVSPIDLNRFHLGYFIRKNLETAAAARAAEIRSFENLCKLRACLTAQEDCFASERMEEFFLQDERMHQLLFETAGVGEVWDVVNAAKIENDRVRHIKRAFKIKRPEDVLVEHTAIIDAIEKQDSGAAVEAMNAHLGTLEDKLKELTSHKVFWEFFENLNQEKR